MPIKKLVNKDFFKKWGHDMAYVLGFFLADGSYDVNPRGSEYFSFQITDRELLYAIRKVLKSEHKIAIRLPHSKNDSVQYRLQIGSKVMCDDLQKFGVRVQKSHTAKFPAVPAEYISSFIRGYFDGDGNIWCGYIHKQRRVHRLSILAAFTSCSHTFLLGIQKECRNSGMGKGSLFKINKGDAFRLQYSVKDSIILFNLMYGKSIQNGLFLERKKKVFEKFVENKKLRL